MQNFHHSWRNSLYFLKIVLSITDSSLHDRASLLWTWVAVCATCPLRWAVDVRLLDPTLSPPMSLQLSCEWEPPSGECASPATPTLSWLASRPLWATSQVWGLLLWVKCRGLSDKALGHPFWLLSLLDSGLCSRELSLASKWRLSESLIPTGWPRDQSSSDTDHPESASDCSGLRALSQRCPNFRRQSQVLGPQVTCSSVQLACKFKGSHSAPFTFSNLPE